MAVPRLHYQPASISLLLLAAAAFGKRQPLEKGRVYEVEVDLGSTSLIFNKGHRIRVTVSSSNAPRFEPNANTGDPHPVAGQTRVATNTVHLSAAHPSNVFLPLYAGPGAHGGKGVEKSR